MNNLEHRELFDRVFKYKGGIFNIDNFQEGTKIIFNDHKAKAIRYIESCQNHESLIKKAPAIYFNYINNPELGAVAACTKEGIYLLGINSGTIIILYDLFFRMLSNPNIVKNIGEAKLETKENPTIQNYYLNANLLITWGDIDYNNYQMAIPNDKTRQAYARHLVDIAIDFIVVHEFAHIIKGHTDYYKNKFGESVYDERNIKVPSDTEVLTIQTLEMDADSKAVSDGIANAIKRHLGEYEVSADRKGFYSTSNNSIFNWLLAVLTLNRIMVESLNYKDKNLKSITHPHPRVKHVMILDTTLQYLSKFYPEQFKLFSPEVCGELTVTIETTYKSITGKSIDKDKYLKTIEEGKEYLVRVIDHWETIRNELQEMSFVKLTE